MSKLKRIIDLKIGDTVWMTQGENPIKECKVTLISTTRIVIDGYYETNLKSEDFTRFVFESEYRKVFYLDKLMALKKQRELLDESIVKLYQNQRAFIESIIEKNEEIRKCDINIAETLLNTNL